MKIKEIRTETDENGEFKVMEQTNGIAVRILRKPSNSYKAKAKERADAQKIKDDAQKVIDDKEKLIKGRMRQIAIDQLRAEGQDV